MGSGYVLDFSNRTFQEFVFDSTGLDIDSEEVGGLGSKASRLRYFWKHQPDHIVGKLLKDLVDDADSDTPLAGQCRSIADRLLAGHRPLRAGDVERIWGKSGYRVFLSHKSEVKKETAELKKQLEVFGIKAFVAHADIQPTEEWQTEIENALSSMHAFVAILTEDFHESDWTDQEVGYALSRGIPLIALKVGRDPYGFIGKFQALSCSWEDGPLRISRLLVRHRPMLEAYLQAVRTCKTFDDGNLLSQVLPAIEAVAPADAEVLIDAFNENGQLNGSYGFNGTWDSKFGPGLAVHLSRMTGGKYVIEPTGQPWPSDRRIVPKNR